MNISYFNIFLFLLPLSINAQQKTTTNKSPCYCGCPQANTKNPTQVKPQPEEYSAMWYFKEINNYRIQKSANNIEKDRRKPFIWCDSLALVAEKWMTVLNSNSNECKERRKTILDSLEQWKKAGNLTYILNESTRNLTANDMVDIIYVKRDLKYIGIASTDSCLIILFLDGSTAIGSGDGDGFVFAFRGINCKQACVKCANMDKQIDKKLTLKLINEIRSVGRKCGEQYMPAAKPLTWNEKLYSAAQKHSDYMCESGNFSHTGFNFTSVGQRIKLEGYIYNYAGENIAMTMAYKNYNTIDRALEIWLNSPGHCENIMNANFEQVAVARRSNYWTMDLGTPVSASEREFRLRHP